MNKQKEYAKEKRVKRLKFLVRVGIPYLIITTLIFIFGYDKTLSIEDKIIEFLPPFIFILLIIIFIAFKKYRIHLLCPNCGLEIKNVKNDCIPSNARLVETINKTEYENKTTTIKGNTVYPRGGYSMRNSIMEYTSESTYEINEKVPVVKKYYVYNIEYRCKKCNEVIYNYQFESKKTSHNKR